MTDAVQEPAMHQETLEALASASETMAANFRRRNNEAFARTEWFAPLQQDNKQTKRKLAYEMPYLY